MPAAERFLGLAETGARRSACDKSYFTEKILHLNNTRPLQKIFNLNR
jgi:hypothetical protein